MNEDTGEPERQLGRPDDAEETAAPVDDRLGAAAPARSGSRRPGRLRLRPRRSRGGRSVRRPG